MRLVDTDSGSFRFSTQGVAPGKRLAALREIFGEMIRLDFEATQDQPVEAELAVDITPGLRRTRIVSPLTARIARPAHMLADGEDSLCLIMKTGGKLALSQRGVEAEAADGDALLLMYREPADLRFSDLTYVAVRVPFAALQPLATDVELATARRIPGSNEALRLLRGYLPTLPARFEAPQMSRLAAAHVYDLIALALGATEEAAQTAGRGGLRAARLDAVKRDLARNADLRLDELARRHRITPRYVQLLFEDEGTSFSAFVRDLRLAAAHAMLASPRYRAWTLTSIAFEAGFGDLSHFNRCFRRHYGMTPSDHRARSAAARDG
ncbi:helix-turn-helix transcriptional regulator [Maliponia aquimaris]|uniref:Transcriptional activator NphR n=1 Tax=Maliponia aquimaris TaxID=1673631 RepID=A0A238K1J4_9RHOB|nr:AraC family transcriptional regulator [Maliponia aquimaris]SMX36791.1 Transcriptional activator NphR [Maliponia aquimaris]